MPDTKRLTWQYLAFGILCTWLAGLGRYWDHPNATAFQYLGLGSLVYVVLMAVFLWILVKPLRPANWTLRSVLTFVALTSPPALLYAIPVERFMSMGNAQMANLIFLVVVAAWRVALLVVYLRRSARLSAGATAIATLLPITIILTVLVILNLDHAVFEFMGGMRGEEGGRPETSADAAYALMFVVSILSVWPITLPVLFVVYLTLCFNKPDPSPGSDTSVDSGTSAK